MYQKYSGVQVDVREKRSIPSPLLDEQTHLSGDASNVHLCKVQSVKFVLGNKERIRYLRSHMHRRSHARQEAKRACCLQFERIVAPQSSLVQLIAIPLLLHLVVDRGKIRLFLIPKWHLPAPTVNFVRKVSKVQASPPLSTSRSSMGGAQLGPALTEREAEAVLCRRTNRIQTVSCIGHQQLSLNYL